MEDSNDDFPFNGLFSPIEKIVTDFDRLFSCFSTTEFQNNHYGDENLDSTIEKHALNAAFPRTVIITTMKQETTPSGRCIIEKQIQ
ncbi:unnamed protein product [Rotaria sp. Silwood1]|nr:unnamed protein product [Rotaria sp. Silwood1]CAF1683129.1 unnamed protein product [Rotaria sp. Silwood1]